MRSGAKFAGPVAVHHDNFAMWNSELTRWNSYNMGPHRDVTSELGKAIKSRGLKFITTFHHGYAWRYYEFSFKYDGADPKNADLYTDYHEPMAPPSKKNQDQWLAMVYEVLNKYNPDLIWFDFEIYELIQPEYQQRMFSMTCDWALQQNRTIGVCHKDRKIHENTGILDFERGREDDIRTYPWLTDSPVGNWFYQKSADYKSVSQLVTTLADIVSKNGCLLLNVGPKVDGTIPDRDRDVLIGIGDWLKVNGEAIYTIRPWKIYGEGPTGQGQTLSFSEHSDKPYTSGDIRFTQSKDKKTLYAIALGIPKDSKIVVKSLAKAAGKISDVSLVGYSGEIKWVQADNALVVTLPADNKCVNAVTLKIKAGEFNPNPTEYEKVSEVTPSGVYKLLYSDAEIHGTTPIIQNGDGESRISQWENPNDFVSWEVQFDQVGTYEVELKYSCKEHPSEFAIEMGTQKISGKTTPTGMWKSYRSDNVGLLYIEKSGKYTLFLKPKSVPKWNGIGLNSIAIKRKL